MTTIIEFLTAQLNEDERIATAALGVLGVESPWWQWETLKARFPGGLSRADARQMERHGPHRALGDAAAKRAILTEHEHVPATEPSVDDFGCKICAYDRGDCVQYGWGWCDTVKHLASAYADHPDYDESWRP